MGNKDNGTGKTAINEHVAKNGNTNDDIEVGTSGKSARSKNENSKNQKKKSSTSSHKQKSSSKRNKREAKEKIIEKAVVTVVEDLDVYEGATLEDRIDTFIGSHNVVMINRTWCLFSVDAQEFLCEQLNVDVFSLEVDRHHDGKRILKHCTQKTNHGRTPIIFIKGAFLGGFEDVNNLYAQGKLQSDYLTGITSQADRCDRILTKKCNTKTLFYFPMAVDGNIVRIMGCITSALSLLSAIIVHYYVQVGRIIAYILAFDFILRVVGGAKISIIGNIASVINSILMLQPNKRSGRPKQFASMCGLLFSSLASLLYIIPFEYHDILGAIFMGVLACCCGMEGFLDFCMGCLFFQWGITLGIIPK